MRAYGRVAGDRAVNREAWDEVKQLFAPSVSVESRRKIVGFQRIDVPSSQWPQDMRRYLETGMVRSATRFWPCEAIALPSCDWRWARQI